MNNWRNKRVLITGSAGVIGTEMVDRLTTAGAVVMGIDLCASDIPGSMSLVADLSHGVPEEATSFDPEVVFHLAASFERSEETPAYWITNYENNVVATHLLHRSIAGMKGLSAFVFASSYLIYDPALYKNRSELKLLCEDDPIRPRNLTGIAKYLAERELEFIQRGDPRFRAVSARIYRVYGRGSRDIISRWVRSAIADEVLDVWGIRNRFDYVYAGDVAEGMIQLAASDAASGVVNLATGSPRSVGDVIETLRKHFPRLKTNIREAAGEPLEASGADMNRFKKLAGVDSAVSLEEGIGRLVKFELNRSACQLKGVEAVRSLTREAN